MSDHELVKKNLCQTLKNFKTQRNPRKMIHGQLKHMCNMTETTSKNKKLFIAKQPLIFKD